MTKFAGLVAATLLLAPLPALAFEPGNTECIAPAAAGGGWDFTCRQVGKVLYDLKIVPNPVQVTNLAGGGGGVAYAEVFSKRDADNNLVVAASSATTDPACPGRLPGLDHGSDALGRQRRLGLRRHRRRQGFADQDACRAVRQDESRSRRSVAFAGGSAVGGWDHLKVLIAAKAAGINDVTKIKYVAFDGGGEAVTQLLGGHVQAFTGDLSEAKGFADSGDIRILAVLAPDRLPGDFANYPTAKEQGIDAVGANWRGFYAPGKMTDDAYNFWVDAMKKVYDFEGMEGHHGCQWPDAARPSGRGFRCLRQEADRRHRVAQPRNRHPQVGRAA